MASTGGTATQSQHVRAFAVITGPAAWNSLSDDLRDPAGA